MGSIRQGVLLHVLALFVVCAVAVTAITYSESRHEVEELFDAQLAQAAAVLAEFGRGNISADGMTHDRLAKGVYGHRYERKISFQVWEGDRLVFRSLNAPPTRLANHLGFADITVESSNWRVFGLHSDFSGYTILAAQSYAIRDELVDRITLNVLLPLLMALPVLGLGLWFGVGRGLNPLTRLATEIKRRNPALLTPIENGKIPLEIRPLTQSLNSLLTQLQAALEREQQFTADAAHELRTPLAGIRTQAQVALRSTGGTERDRALRHLILGVERSTHLVEQLLTLARLESAMLERQSSTVDLGCLAEAVIADLADTALNKHVELSLADHCAGSSQRALIGFEPSLEVLLRNLVDNAVRHTPAGGCVEVALSATRDNLLLSVSDTGPGIAPGRRQRLFDRFYREPGQQSEGCGLGLSIVKRIADLHQAAVALSDNPAGRGLRVTISFVRALA